MYNQFKNFAEYLDEAYGCVIIYDEETGLIESVECPECGEPIYECDWDAYSDWECCPICDWNFMEGM